MPMVQGSIVQTMAWDPLMGHEVIYKVVSNSF